MDLTERLIAAGEWILGRLQEPSTWRGVVLMVTAGSWAALDHSSRGELVAQIGMFVAGAIQSALPQRALYRTEPKE